MREFPPPACLVYATSWPNTSTPVERLIPAEVAVAISFDGAAYAVLMGTPLDLRELAVGFSLTEGIIETPADIESLEVVVLPLGIECRIRLVSTRRVVLETRRRRLTGPMGCGLCGVDSLEEALKPPPFVTSQLSVTAPVIMSALSRLPLMQPLNAETHAAHAAAIFVPEDGKMFAREDVGRHNALDKVIGAATASGILGNTAIVFITSRVSVELIQKTAAFGAGILVAVSAPSTRAVQDANTAGVTLVAIARHDGFEVFTHPHRITMVCAPDQSSG